MLRIVLVLPGSTDLDDQGRIKGSLDLPMNERGASQVEELSQELAAIDLAAIYTAPCLSARKTADVLAAGRDVKVKILTKLRNLDHGLWHGKLIEEVRRGQPKVYRQWQDQPETVCPPEGESVAAATARVRAAVAKIMRKHRSGVVAVVTPEPLASLVRSALNHDAIGDLWKVECKSGGWELIAPEPVAVA